MNGFLPARLFAAAAAVCLAATVTLLALRQPVAGIVGVFGVIFAIMAHDLAARERFARKAAYELERSQARELAHRRMAALMALSAEPLEPFDQEPPAPLALVKGEAS